MKNIFLATLLLFSFISCDSDDDSIDETTFTGNWSGVYNSNDDLYYSAGTWTLIVHSNNTITGNYIEDQTNLEYSGSGTIDSNGNVTVGFYEFGDDQEAGKFTGTFTSAGTASGTWFNQQHPNYNGTWTGSKD